MADSKQSRLVGARPSLSREIGNWLWCLQDSRDRTLRVLDGLSQEHLDRVGPGIDNSIGTLLYHIAAIEMSYLYEDLLIGEPFPKDLELLLNYDVRDQDGRLIPVFGENLQQHINRLTACRSLLLKEFEKMSLDDFKKPIEIAEYTISAQWIVHHLMQHEAEHRGQIEILRELWKKRDSI